MVQDGAIVTMADQYKVVHGLSFVLLFFVLIFTRLYNSAAATLLLYTQHQAQTELPSG